MCCAAQPAITLGTTCIMQHEASNTTHLVACEAPAGPGALQQLQDCLSLISKRTRLCRLLHITAQHRHDTLQHGQ